MLSAKIEIGKINTLQIERESPHGLYLTAKDGQEVLLPNIYVTQEMKIGKIIEVFLYRDSEDRLVATTQHPKAMLGSFAYLEVVDKNKNGFFLDWGLPKDLFVPLKEQKGLQIGDKRVFYIDLDHDTNRLYASQKIGKYLQEKPHLHKSQKVEILIFAKTPMGYKAIIDNAFSGMIYANECFEEIVLGTKREAFVKQVRADHKVDLSLTALGKGAVEDATQKILTALEANHGTLNLNYKSDAEEIKKQLGLSKKSFKRALTTLIGQNRITLNEKIQLSVDLKK